MPHSLELLINLLTIWALVWMSAREKGSDQINSAFVLMQSGLGGVTLLSASYTKYLIDLSDSMSFGLSVFAAIKLVQSMDDRWSRARPGFRKAQQNSVKGQLLLLGFLDHDIASSQTKQLQTEAERVVGLSNVVRVDDLFGGESFMKSRCKQFRALLINVKPEQSNAIRAFLSQVSHYLALDFSFHDIEHTWATENKEFTNEVIPLVLACAVRLLSSNGAIKD